MRIYFRESSGNVLINGQQYTIDNHCVKLDIPEKWQLLEFQSDTYIKILDIELDEQKIGHHLYIMFDENKKCTFGDIFNGRISYMPIHPRWAVFFTTVAQQLLNGWYGKEIYDHFEFAIDRPVKFKNPQPKFVQDFYLQDTGAHWIKKYDESSTWFFDKDEVHDVEAIKEWLDPYMFNRDTAYSTSNGWEIRNLKNITPNELRQRGLGWFGDWAEKQNFSHISTVSCNILHPGGSIDMHIDGNMELPLRKKVYVNLHPSEHVYFRFRDTGLVPMNTPRTLWLNTDQYVHGVVNDTSTSRIILSINGDAEWV